MTRTDTPSAPVWQRRIAWIVLIAIVVLSGFWVSRHYESGVERRASLDANGELGVAVSPIRTALKNPAVSGDELVAAAGVGVAAAWSGQVMSSRVTGSGASIDAYVDGHADEGGGLFGTSAVRRLCVRITIDRADDPQIDLRDIACTGAAADMPPGAEETNVVRRATPRPDESQVGDGVCFGTSGDCPGG